MTFRFNDFTFAIFEDIRKAGGVPFVVGGFVRDFVMGFDPKDIDVEVFNISFDVLVEILRRHSDNVNMVGASFGIIKVDMRDVGGDDLEFSLPRTENKSGRGHRGFVVSVDRSLTPTEASRRRDVTINSMFIDPFTMEIHDPHDGIGDITKGVLRATSFRFMEDALRVLRLMQFASRFNMRISLKTRVFSRLTRSEFPALSSDRIWGEFAKMFTKGASVSAGLRVLVETGWISLFPVLNALRGTKQEHRFHPEGDAWVHTLEACDHAVTVANREGLDVEDRIVLMLAVLLHDVGKPSTTEKVDGVIVSRGHDTAGEAPAREFMASIGCPNRIVRRVIPLIVNHMAHVHNRTFSRKAVRRLARRVFPSTIRMLSFVMESDHSGRGSMPKGRTENMDRMVELASDEKIVNAPPTPILMGRHLIEMGMTPSVEFGVILNEAMEAQLSGVFCTLEGAIAWFRNR